MDVRKAVRVLLVGLVLPGLWLAGFTTGAGAGAIDFEILKRVEGTPPPGTEFAVTLACEGVQILPGGVENGQNQVVVRFDAAGNALDTAGFRFEGEGTCTVTETQTGGATAVTYECFQTAGDPSEGGPPPCTPSGPQQNPVTLNVTTPRSPASVVVTNTFEPSRPPEPPRPVPAAPRLTG
jgi:hypothetical protein